MLRRPVVYACLCTALAGGWQWLTVACNYSGNWTALFRTGDWQAAPPTLQAESIHVFRGQGRGFDGQYYHYIAHDPFFQGDLAGYIDRPRYRYGKILVPVLAHLLAFGQQRYVDAAYFAVLLLAVFAGTFWLSGLAAIVGRHPAWGSCFLLAPSVIISAGYGAIDSALTALCAGFARYMTSNELSKVYPILLLAPLARETGLILILACGLAALAQRRYARAGITATAMAPCLAWAFFVAHHTSPSYPSPRRIVPFLSILEALQSEEYRSLATQILHAGALVALWSAFGLSILVWRRRGWQPVALACVLFSGMGALVLSSNQWHRTIDFARVFSPLLILMAAEGAALRIPWTAAILLVNSAAALLLLGEQVLGVWRRLGAWF